MQRGNADIEAFIEAGVEEGASLESIQEMLLDDLDNDGPIFGQFFRNLRGAAAGSVVEAERQGESVQYIANAVRDNNGVVVNSLNGLSSAIKSNPEILAGMESADEIEERLLRVAEGGDALEDIINRADPRELALVERATEDSIELTSIAMLVNTCHICLPLHGISRTRAEWAEAGLLPSMRHPSDWGTSCKCRLVPRGEVDAFQGGGNEVIAPLVREKVKSPTGLKTSKRTQRSIAQKSLDKSLEAVAAAQKTLEGRRTMRLMGKVNKDQEQ